MVSTHASAEKYLTCSDVCLHVLHNTCRYLEVMTQIAETCVKYEEALSEKEYPLCEDIPEWRRIHSSGLGKY